MNCKFNSHFVQYSRPGAVMQSKETYFVPIDVKTFTPFIEEQVDTGSHWTRRGTLPDSQQTWFCKTMRDPMAAKIELLAQEFFRFLIPHQPETRLAADKNHTLHVLSQEVPGYKSLPLNQQNNFSNGVFTGLGQALVCSVFLEEVDLKNGNICLDEENRVIKIDGDWCFAELKTDYTEDRSFNLSPKTIASLPYPMDFPAFEWLDYTVKWVKNRESKIVNPTLSNSKQFRTEVNEAILKICLLPDSFIEAFTEFYLPSEGKRFSDLMKARRDILKQSALQNNSFKDYLKTQEAKNAVNAVLEQIKTFKSAGVFVFNPDLQAKLTKEISQLDWLSVIWPEYKKCYQLILSLEGQLNPKDTQLAQFILDTIESIEEKKNNPKNLQQNIINLNDAFAAMDSAEFKAVINAIASFNANIGFFMESKAENITKALYNTPLSERDKVISNPTANDVQRALASHRHPLRDNPILSGGKIDYDKAANAYKNLKDRFTPIEELSDEQEIKLNLN